jgi:hypothetical protein
MRCDPWPTCGSSRTYRRARRRGSRSWANAAPLCVRHHDNSECSVSVSVRRNRTTRQHAREGTCEERSIDRGVKVGFLLLHHHMRFVPGVGAAVAPFVDPAVPLLAAAAAATTALGRAVVAQRPAGECASVRRVARVRSGETALAHTPARTHESLLQGRGGVHEQVDGQVAVAPARLHHLGNHLCVWCVRIS